MQAEQIDGNGQQSIQQFAVSDKLHGGMLPGSPMHRASICSRSFSAIKVVTGQAADESPSAEAAAQLQQSSGTGAVMQSQF